MIKTATKFTSAIVRRWPGGSTSNQITNVRIARHKTMGVK